jgi:hypothetical protein
MFLLETADFPLTIFNRQGCIDKTCIHAVGKNQPNAPRIAVSRKVAFEKLGEGRNNLFTVGDTAEVTTIFHFQ